MNRKSVINILCALSAMIAVGIADDYINNQYLIGVSSGIALILCIIRSYMPK